MEITCEQFNQWYPAAMAVWVLLEYWLGETDKTKSGSSLALVYNLLKAIIKRKP